MNERHPGHRDCPICDSSDADVLYSLDMLSQGDFLPPSEHLVVACDRCGLVFQDSSASLGDYERYYGNLGKYIASPTIVGETEELFSHYIHILKAHIVPDSAILDMGCAGGLFLGLLKEAGFTNLAGVDPSDECIMNVTRSGIEGYSGSIYSQEFTFLEDRFDLIILSGVLEHLFDLKTAVYNLDRYLKSDGVIFIGVPDARRYATYYNSLSYYFNFEHINHFSSASLDNLMRQFAYGNIQTDFHDIPFGDALVPVFSSVYGRDPSISTSLKKDTISRESVKEYFDIYAAKTESLYKSIEDLSRTDEQIMIWGAGAVAMELLLKTRLKDCNIKGFVDKDTAKHGKHLLGKPISPVTTLKDFEGIIVVCAAIYASDIVREIREMNLKNRVLVFR